MLKFETFKCHARTVGQLETARGFKRCCNVQRKERLANSLLTYAIFIDYLGVFFPTVFLRMEAYELIFIYNLPVHLFLSIPYTNINPYLYNNNNNNGTY